MKIARLVVLLFWCCWAHLAQAETPVEGGRYIVEVIGAWGNCHTPHGPWGVTVSANITPRGLGHRSDAEIKQIITTGVRARRHPAAAAHGRQLLRAPDGRGSGRHRRLSEVVAAK